jgi:hypothetical protein
MFLRFPVDLTPPPAALYFSSQFPVLSENRFEALPVAALRANAAVANYFEIVSSVPSQFPGFLTEN